MTEMGLRSHVAADAALGAMKHLFPPSRRCSGARHYGRFEQPDKIRIFGAGLCSEGHMRWNSRGISPRPAGPLASHGCSAPLALGRGDKLDLAPALACTAAGAPHTHGVGPSRPFPSSFDSFLSASIPE